MTTPQKPKLGLAARIGLIFGGFVVLAIWAGLSNQDDPAPVAQSAPSTATTTAPRATYAKPTHTPPPTTAAPAPTAAAAPASPRTSFGDGTWIVGTDIEPGTYRSSGATPGFFEFCSATTRSGASSNSDMIDWVTANANEPVVIEIGPKVKAFDVSGCEPFVKVG
jgi:hypothetical protein